MNFKIKSLDHFLPSFLGKNGNFKTRDFSPLIRKVLAGVGSFAWEKTSRRPKTNFVWKLWFMTEDLLLVQNASLSELLAAFLKKLAVIWDFFSRNIPKPSLKIRTASAIF